MSSDGPVLLFDLLESADKRKDFRFRGSPRIEAAYRLGSVLHLHLFFQQ